MAFVHTDYCYSVALHADDRAVLNCLRALSQISQQQGNVRIPWGGTTDAAWEDAGHQVTFRFTSPAYRQGFTDRASSRSPTGYYGQLCSARSVKMTLTPLAHRVNNSAMGSGMQR